MVLMVEVDNLDATLARARELGVTEIREGYEVEGVGSADGRYNVAWIEDPQGNRLALIQAGN